MVAYLPYLASRALTFFRHAWPRLMGLPHRRQNFGLPFFTPRPNVVYGALLKSMMLQSFFGTFHLAKNVKAGSNNHGPVLLVGLYASPLRVPHRAKENGQSRRKWQTARTYAIMRLARSLLRQWVGLVPCQVVTHLRGTI